MTLLGDAVSAYLEPLLKKHAAGESVQWEDLEACHAASSAVIKSSDNFFVSKRVEDLHQSQVQAYREAAVKALREWVQSDVPQEPMEEADTEDAFVERCVTALTNHSPPNWKLDSSQTLVGLEVRKRARATFAKYHPTNDGAAAPTTATSSTQVATESNGSNNGTNDEEDGEMDEDGEEEEGAAEEETEDGQKASETTAPKKKATVQRKKKPIVRKKGTATKHSNNPGQQRRGGPANRGRRGGRGGGNAKSG